ncbi:unnamed protein product [Vicia faba]|uniref:Uncharacterized protein n=1 Tax=Vicia faba TaxID=3906 RepID=A0AAV0YEU2_VICFA|nr:unnamed protein product [Vicia faba]
MAQNEPNNSYGPGFVSLDDFDNHVVTGTTTHIVSFSRAYLNLSIVLSREAECESGFFTQSLGAVNERDSHSHTRVYASFQNDLVDLGQNDPFHDRETNMVEHEGLLELTNGY